MPFPLLEYVCDDGDLTIGSVPMRCPGWMVLDLTALWLPASQRGRNRIVPGANGVIVNPRRATETRHALVLCISGGYDQNGVENADTFAGISDNWDALRTGVFDPPTLPAVSRTATLTMPDGTTRTAQVQLEEPVAVRRVVAVHIYTFDLIIPSGRFA